MWWWGIFRHFIGSNEVVISIIEKEVDIDVVWLVEENDLGLGLRVSAETGSSIPVVAAHTTLFIALYLYKQS